MITQEEFLTEEYISEIFKTGQWSEHGACIEQYIDDNHEDDDFPEEFREYDVHFFDVLKSESFQKHFREWLPIRFRYAKEWLEKDLLSCRSKDGLYTIKRKIFCSNETLSQCIAKDIDIGRFWTTLQPEAYCGSLSESNPIDLVVYAKVSLTDIDFIETMRSRMDYTNGDMESEIYVKKESIPIFVKLSWIDDNEIRDIDCMTEARELKLKEKVNNV